MSVKCHNMLSVLTAQIPYDFYILCPRQRRHPNCVPIEHHWNVCEFLLIQSLRLFFPKLRVMAGGNNETVVLSVVCPISDLFGKGETILS